MTCSRFLGVLTLATVVVLALAPSASAVSLVANGDFSSNAALFTTSPGYTGGSNPAAIDNWTKTSVGGARAAYTLMRGNGPRPTGVHNAPSMGASSLIFTLINKHERCQLELNTLL